MRVDMVADKVADMVADTVADNKKVTFMELDVVADKTADMVADMEADKKKVANMDWRLQGSSFVSLIETLYLLTTPTGQRYIVNSSSGKFEGKGEEEYKKFFLSYDNMCHLDSLRLFVVH